MPDTPHYPDYSCSEHNSPLDSYFSLFENNLDSVMVIKGDQYIYCNAATLNELSYPDKATFLKLTPWDISPEFQADGQNSKEKTLDLIALTHQQGQHRFDWQHQCYDGQLINVVVTLTAITLLNESLLQVSWSNNCKKELLIKQLKTLSCLQDAIFNSRNFSCIATDAKGMIQLFNVGAEAMLGYTAKEVINIMTPAEMSVTSELQHRANILSLEFGETIESGFEALAYKATREIEDIYELSYVCKKGHYLTAQVSITALRDEKQIIIGYLLIATDNTARKLLENTQINIAKAFESGLAMFITDAQGNYTHANKAYSDMTGYSQHELIGKNPSIMKSERQDLKFYKNMWKTIHKQGHWSGEIWNKRKNGEIHLELLNINKTTDLYGNTSHFVATFANNEHRKAYEDNLLETQEQTHKLLIETQRSEELELDVAKANQAVLTKSQFLSNMSHEIRTPINAIMSIAFLTLQTDLTAQQQNYLSKINSSAKWLLGILDDILNFSKLEAGKVELEQNHFELDAIIDFLKTVTTPLVINKDLNLNFKVESSVPSVFIGDSLRLGQVLLNLMSNAIKFTHSGSITLNVKLISLIDQQAQLQFSVTDTGIGLDTKHKKDLFEAFNQADNSTTRLYGGTGLGLSICKELVSAMGGIISVESQLGAGSCFSFIITLAVSTSPVTPALPTTSLKHAVKYPNLLNARVLVVEDNLVIQEFIPDIMGYEGMIVDLANNGVEALALLTDNDYAAVLMDCQMPIMDGFEATQRIRANPRYDDLPIIAMTGNVDESDRQRCYDCGMNGFISKPVDWDQAFLTLNRLINPES